MKKFISVLTFSVFFGVFAYAQTNDNSDANTTGNVNVENVVAEPVKPHSAAANAHDGKDCDMTSAKSCCNSKKVKSSASAGKKSCCMAKAEAAPAKTEENEN